jgi:hypothetical protein
MTTYTEVFGSNAESYERAQVAKAAAAEEAMNRDQALTKAACSAALARPGEEGFHVLAGDECSPLRLAFAQQLACDKIADLAFADLEISGGFFGCVGPLLRNEPFCFHLR